MSLALPQQKVAAVLGAATKPTPPPTWPATSAFLVGAEDEGLDDDWRAIADTRGRDPDAAEIGGGLAQRGAAAAVLLFEALRQREREPLAQALLLRDPAGENVTGHEHVLVRTVHELERLAVLLRVVCVERTLELQDVRGQVVDQRGLRQADRLREERPAPGCRSSAR